MPGLLAGSYCALGAADDCAERIADFAKVGVRDFILVPLAAEWGRALEQLELYARDLIPKVKEAVG